MVRRVVIVGVLLELVATSLLLKYFYCIFIFHFQLESRQREGGERGRRRKGEREGRGGRKGGREDACIDLVDYFK